jgi:hypothetical protein
MGRVTHALLVGLKWIGIAIGALVALLVVVTVVLPPLTRPMTDRLGATMAEAEKPLAGDDLVTDPQQASTRAVSIDAPAELVFALVKQQGYGRGGWYGWDWFYQATGSADFVDGHHSVRIDPALQAFGTGDEIELFPGAGLEAVACEAPRALVLYKLTDGDNKPVAFRAPKPEAFSDMSWAWIVEPTGEDSCRLLLRTRASSKGLGGFAEWVNDKPLELGSAVFGYKTLRGIRRTAEQLDDAGVVVDERGTQTAGPARGLEEARR